MTTQQTNPSETGIIAVGMNNKLFTQYTRESNWEPAPDKGTANAVTVMPNGTLLYVGTNGKLFTQDTLESNWVPAPDKGTANAVTVMPNGTLLYVGTNGKLFTQDTLESNWVPAPDKGTANAVTVMPNGTLLYVGTNGKLFTQDTLESNWVPAPDKGTAWGVTVMPNGTLLYVGTNGKLFTQDTLESNWVPAPDKGTARAIAPFVTPGNYLGVEQVPALVAENAPIAFFNTNEEYFPCPIDDFLQAAEEVNGTGDYPGLGLSLRSRGEVLPGHSKPIIHGNLDGNVASYVNVKIARAFTDIQYWFFYAYNGPGTMYLKRAPVPPFELEWQAIGDYSLEPCGQHEGDWEHVTVRVNNETMRASQVYLSQHGDGVWVNADSQRDANGRIQFYVSKYGHAAYEAPARWYTQNTDLGVIEFRLLNDTSNPDRYFDTQKRTHIIGLHRDLADISEEASFVEKPHWMKYDGRWGEVLLSRQSPLVEKDVIPGISFGWIMDKVGLYEECEQEAGPEAPWVKGNWTGAE